MNRLLRAAAWRIRQAVDAGAPHGGHNVDDGRSTDSTAEATLGRPAHRCAGDRRQYRAGADPPHRRRQKAYCSRHQPKFWQPPSPNLIQYTALLPEGASYENEDVSAEHKAVPTLVLFVTPCGSLRRGKDWQAENINSRSPSIGWDPSAVVKRTDPRKNTECKSPEANSMHLALANANQILMGTSRPGNTAPGHSSQSSSPTLLICSGVSLAIASLAKRK